MERVFFVLCEGAEVLLGVADNASHTADGGKDAADEDVVVDGGVRGGRKERDGERSELKKNKKHHYVKG